MVGSDRKMNQPLKITPIGSAQPVPQFLPNVVCLKVPPSQEFPPTVLEKLLRTWRAFLRLHFAISHHRQPSGSGLRINKITERPASFQAPVEAIRVPELVDFAATSRIRVVLT
jgi:hypothetical protein